MVNDQLGGIVLNNRRFSIAIVGLLILSGLMGSARALSIDSNPVLTVEPETKYLYEVVPSNYTATVNMTTDADWLFLVGWNVTGIPNKDDIGIWNVSLNITLGAVVVWQNYSIDVFPVDHYTDNLELGLGLIFCFAFLVIGLKQPTFLVLAGIVWIVVSLTIFISYGELFMMIGLATGLGSLFMGASRLW